MDIQTLYNIYLEHKNITTDSRNIKKDSLFFALKGENFDGNAFALDALDKGASYSIIDNPNYATNNRCILVDNVLETLQALALHHRKQLSIPFIGITGTNGKTTTKELVKAVLSKKYRTYATEGNFNNHLGVPLTLLSIPSNAEIAIIEMGANHIGEIDFLCKIALPDFGIITNIGKAHLEGFGSFEGVIRTKTELYNFIKSRNGVLFVNADNELLMQNAHGINHKTYGTTENSNIKGAYRSSNPYMNFYFENTDVVYSVNTKLLGKYNFDNAMAAVCIGAYFNVDLFNIKEAIENYEPSNSRSQMKQTPLNKLILDCYNANPSSMKAAIENFGTLNISGKKVIMLGGMKELGSDSEKEHRNVVELVRNYNFDLTVFVGKEFAFVTNNETTLWFDNVTDAKSHFEQNPISNATILLKGSNSVRMGLLENSL
jgi:UDP-N-acetylmuramoyl-tripeptide--D-alanyl-D-alanine ligase